MIVQLIRLICRVLWFVLTHPAVDAVAALIVVTWLGLSWPGLAGLAVVAVTGLAGLRVIHRHGSPFGGEDRPRWRSDRQPPG